MTINWISSSGHDFSVQSFSELPFIFHTYCKIAHEFYRSSSYLESRSDINLSHKKHISADECLAYAERVPFRDQSRRSLGKYWNLPFDKDENVTIIFIRNYRSIRKISAEKLLAKDDLMIHLYCQKFTCLLWHYEICRWLCLECSHMFGRFSLLEELDWISRLPGKAVHHHHYGCNRVHLDYVEKQSNTISFYEKLFRWILHLVIFQIPKCAIFVRTVHSNGLDIHSNCTDNGGFHKNGKLLQWNCCTVLLDSVWSLAWSVLSNTAWSTYTHFWQIFQRDFFRDFTDRHYSCSDTRIRISE